MINIIMSVNYDCYVNYIHHFNDINYLFYLKISLQNNWTKPLLSSVRIPLKRIKHII